jgi:spermidine/putrescine transport system ATP-binding protein
MMALLEIRNVSRRFGDFTAVDNVNLAIEAGEFFTLLGPSGCGKTTLLRMIAGFDLPDSGQILLDGVDMVGTPPERRPVHTVFQSYALFPHMTVAGNIAFPLKMADTPADQIKAKVAEALDDVRLGDFATRYPHELSGGQRQRVAIARALVTRPKVLLLDEPLSALDAKLREQMQVELINLQKEVGITFIYVTHDQGEALALSHRIAVMNRGKVEQLDEPDRIYSFPCNRFVADFIGTCNLYDGRIDNVEGDVVRLQVEGLGSVAIAHAAGSQPGKSGLLALRPEKIRIAADDGDVGAGNRYRGVVKELLYLGDVTVYQVETEGGARVKALLANSGAGRIRFFEVGDAVGVGWHVDAGHFLHD